MELTRIARWRNYAGKVGALVALLAMLSVLDGLIARFREPADLIRALPGDTVEVNGPLRQAVPSLRDMTYTSTSEHLSLTFDALQRGYFLGGDMWRGRLTVSPQTPPGEYRLSVMVWERPAAAPPLTFRILVYADMSSRQTQSKSLWLRYAGISPWLAAAFCLAGILLAFGSVFLLSQKIETLLAQQGRAEVYRVVKKDGDCLIAFGLGRAHGVQVGATVTLLDPEGQPAGQATVVEVTDTDAAAAVSTTEDIQPGYLVVLG